MQSSTVLSQSPSFNSYSSGELAEIAARVVEEFKAESGAGFDNHVFCFKIEEKINDRFHEQRQDGENEGEANKVEEEQKEDDDFEFPSICEEPASAISADEIFSNGQIKPVFPIFDLNLLFSEVVNGEDKVNSPKRPIRAPLRQLMREERDSPSCSSSEADELDGVPAGTYCVWSPKAVGAAAAAGSRGRCNKSHSMGSSNRWKIRDLLFRSNSDGKDTFVFLAPQSITAKKKVENGAEKAATNGNSTSDLKFIGKVKPLVAGDGRGEKEAHYRRNKVAAPATKEGDRRRSYLPYKQDLVGLFSRNIHPFSPARH